MSLRKFFTGKPGNVREIVEAAQEDRPILVKIIGDSWYDPPAAPYSKFGYATLTAIIGNEEITVRKNIQPWRLWQDASQEEYMEYLRKKSQKIQDYIESQGKTYIVKEEAVFFCG